jgi:hypothetical protein
VQQAAAKPLNTSPVQTFNKSENAVGVIYAWRHRSVIVWRHRSVIVLGFYIRLFKNIKKTPASETFFSGFHVTHNYIYNLIEIFISKAVM